LQESVIRVNMSMHASFPFAKGREQNNVKQNAKENIMSGAFNRLQCMSLLLAGFIGWGSAGAQGYPVKAVRIVLGGPAGGGADVIFRPLAQRLSEQMGQQFIIDNRPGAGSVLSGQVAMAASADGYTLLQASSSGFSIAPYVAKKQPYDPERDFVPVTMVAKAPMMITVHPALPVRNVKELVTLARSRKDQLLYGSNGQASFSHLTAEYFSNTAGIRMTHVPYKGGAPAVIDTVSGHVQIIMTAFPTLIAQVKGGRLRAIAVTGASRVKVLPETPTVAESGYAGFEAVQWYGVFAPKGAPAAIVDRLHAEFRKAGDNPALKTPLSAEGAELAVAGPQALADFLRADIAKWRKVIKEANIVLE
jgi:tripartite-type tricarboxylate transporter receptor subunit TctC